MNSIRSKLIRRFVVKSSMRKLCDPFTTSLEEMRDKHIDVNRRLKLPSDANLKSVEDEEFRAEWLRAESITENTENVILYFHSGAFCLGYSNAHRYLALELSRACNARVLAVDYRLAPEYKFPAANEDCLAAYRWLLKNNVKPQNIVMGGDSAGAGLALMTLLTLKETEKPMPRAAFFLSLFGGDLKNFDGESYKTRKSYDPLNSKEGIQYFAKSYLGEQVLEPSIDKNLEGLPDLLVQVGSDDILLSDSVRLAEQARRAGVKVIFDEWEGMWHAFQGFSMIVPEAKAAISNIAEFINSKVNA
ncbi:MAG: alpha/beta hydrolase [Exilibacterium sp.]